MDYPLIIATYENPDLDGVACGFAYEEFLNKSGRPATFRLFGKYQVEVLYLVNKFNIPLPKIARQNINNHKVIIVDASDIRGLAKNIPAKNVIEVIDHRRVFDISDFPNARFTVEFVGAAATIIAEKFYVNKIEVSRNSAILLFYAIVSNTINFKAKVTTQRDLFIKDWLMARIGSFADYIIDIFEYKTNALIVSKKSFLEGFSAFFNIGGKTIGIIQLEIVHAPIFIKKHKSKCISIMKEIRKQKGLDLVFISNIDLLEGYNLFLTCEDETEKLLSAIFKINFLDNISRTDDVFMRKEIVPLLKSYFKE